MTHYLLSVSSYTFEKFTQQNTIPNVKTKVQFGFFLNFYTIAFIAVNDVSGDLYCEVEHSVPLH